MRQNFQDKICAIRIFRRDMRFLVLLFSAFMVGDSYGFDRDKCARYFHRNIDVSGGRGVITTTQFTSSWGECRMIGQVDNDQKVFMAQAWNQLQIDTAKGNGEYLNAFATLSVCNQAGAGVLKNEMQKNFQQIYGNELDNSVEEAHEQIKNIFNGNEVLKKNCTTKS